MPPADGRQHSAATVLTGGVAARTGGLWLPSLGRHVVPGQLGVYHPGAAQA